MKPLIIDNFSFIEEPGHPVHSMHIELKHTFPESSVRVEKDGDCVKVKIAMAIPYDNLHYEEIKATIKANHIVRFGFVAILLPRIVEDDNDHEPDSILVYVIVHPMEMVYLGSVHRDLVPDGETWDDFQEKTKRWVRQASWLCDRGKEKA